MELGTSFEQSFYCEIVELPKLLSCGIVELLNCEDAIITF